MCVLLETNLKLSTRTNMIALGSIRNLIIDMDGVLWRGEQSMPGMPQFFATLRTLNINFVLATNNAAKSGVDFVQKLARMGATIAVEEILTSSQATAMYLAQHSPRARIYVVGEDGLKSELRARQLTVVDPAEWETADHVVVGIDRTLTYSKLCDACLLIRRGATFIGTNPDVTFPGERGIVPGNGAIVELLRVSTNATPLFIGKPQPTMMVLSMDRMHGTPQNTAVLGDRLDTDILGGINAGLTSIMVTSGVNSRDDVANGSIKPDYIFADITETATALVRART